LADRRGDRDQHGGAGLGPPGGLPGVRPGRAGGRPGKPDGGTGMSAPVTSAHRIGPDTTVGLPALSIVRDGDDYVVGDPATAVFITVPEVAVWVLDGLREGRTVGEVTAAVSARAGTEVDVADFVDTLVQCELVVDLDKVVLRTQI